MEITNTSAPRRRPGRPLRNAEAGRVATRRAYLTPEAREQLEKLADMASAKAGYAVPMVWLLSQMVHEAWAKASHPQPGSHGE